ncbi:MAG TPA: class I SAM-dependent methyltransferase [Gemmatimonadales bacterium]|nr:class I SAM-dependent methyltransferase [Gemmatimonadales bacterium]
MSWQAVEGSFRDPSGFVYTRDGTLFRQVNSGFRQTFEAFLASGLCDELVRDALLVPHEVVGLEYSATPDAYAVLRPERLPFISYPYEWSFGQLQDAAALTLQIQERALRKGFTLRDSSAYNIQFQGGRPIFIDTLSFEPWEEGKPWAAYKQFCEHFLLPLTLMSATDIRCGTLLRSYVDGIPLDLGSRLLPHRSWTSLSAVLHIHLHAWAQGRYAGSAVTSAAKGKSMSQRSLLTLIKNLSTATQRLSWRPSGTEWADYTSDNNYSDVASRSKREMVVAHLAAVKPETVWDLGANTGEYSRAARELAGYVVSFDVDPAAVERNYRRVRSEKETGILPLLLDLTNPSPAQGWAGRERLSLEERGPADAVLALALVHHLAIGNNLPLERIASYFRRLGRHLIIEFVPKSDSQVSRLLLSRPDIFPDYTKEGFEEAFQRHYHIQSVARVADSERRLYAMIPRGPAES